MTKPMTDPKRGLFLLGGEVQLSAPITEDGKLDINDVKGRRQYLRSLLLEKSLVGNKTSYKCRFCNAHVDNPVNFIQFHFKAGGKAACENIGEFQARTDNAVAQLLQAELKDRRLRQTLTMKERKEREANCSTEATDYVYKRPQNQIVRPIVPVKSLEHSQQQFNAINEKFAIIFAKYGIPAAAAEDFEAVIQHIVGPSFRLTPDALLNKHLLAAKGELSSLVAYYEEQLKMKRGEDMLNDDMHQHQLSIDIRAKEDLVPNFFEETSKVSMELFGFMQCNEVNCRKKRLVDQRVIQAYEFLQSSGGEVPPFTCSIVGRSCIGVNDSDSMQHVAAFALYSAPCTVELLKNYAANGGKRSLHAKGGSSSEELAKKRKRANMLMDNSIVSP